jgi:hypothetical protein
MPGMTWRRPVMKTTPPTCPNILGEPAKKSPSPQKKGRRPRLALPPAPIRVNRSRLQDIVWVRMSTSTYIVTVLAPTVAV